MSREFGGSGIGGRRLVGALGVERTSEREVVITRTIDGPARVFFDPFTKPELLKRWWTPKSFGVFCTSHPRAPASTPCARTCRITAIHESELSEGLPRAERADPNFGPDGQRKAISELRFAQTRSRSNDLADC